MMINIKLPEHLQRRVHSYYDEVLESRLIWSQEFFTQVSSTAIEKIKEHQIKDTVDKLSFINKGDKKEIEKLLINLEHSFYLPNDIIIKQGYFNDKFYFVHQGILEVIQHKFDFMFFDYKEVKSHFDNIKKQNPDRVVDNNETIYEEGSVYDPNPTLSKLVTRAAQNMNIQQSSNEIDETSDLPEGSLISELSLIKKNSSTIYQDSFTHNVKKAKLKMKLQSQKAIPKMKFGNPTSFLFKNALNRESQNFSRVR